MLLEARSSFMGIRERERRSAHCATQVTLENVLEASIKGGEGVKEKVPGARPRARVAQRRLCPGTALSPGALSGCWDTLGPAALAPKVSSALGPSSTGHSGWKRR